MSLIWLLDTSSEGTGASNTYDTVAAQIKLKQHTVADFPLGAGLVTSATSIMTTCCFLGC